MLYADRSINVSGFAEGETYLATVAVAEDGHFTYTHAGDLRGFFATGVTLQSTDYFGEFTFTATSEFGPPAQVQ